MTTTIALVRVRPDVACEVLEALRAIPAPTPAILEGIAQLRAALAEAAEPGEEYTDRDIDEAQRLLGLHGPLVPLDGEGL